MARNEKEYIVYDNKTDFPVCLGTLNECSQTLGVPKCTLKSTTTRFFNGERADGRYILYDLDKLERGGYLEDEQLYEN